MRFVLVLWLCSFSSVILAEGGRKRSYSNQQYSNGYGSGATQSGSAQAERDVNINDEANQTHVDETYRRQHQYQTGGTPSGTTTGTYHNGSQVNRAYFHYGNGATKEKIQAYETKRIGLLNQVDALYTRSENCKNTLTQNPSMTQAERKGFEREIKLISYEIGQIGAQLGNFSFEVEHPDRKPNPEFNQMMFESVWSQSPNQYIPVFLEIRLKDVNWQLTYLSDLQGSMATPYAQVKATDNRNVHAEITEKIEQLKRDKQKLRR